MKMIWITQESLFPVNTGGRIGVFKRLEQIYREHDIYLFYTYDHDEEAEYISRLKKYCKGVYAYKRRKNLATLFRSLRYPFCIASRNIKAMHKDLKNCIVENEISVINVDFPQMCVNLLHLAKKYSLKVVLNEHNIEWQFYQMISKSSKKLLKKIAYGFDSKRLKRYEEKLVKRIKFDAITFVSDKDMRYHEIWLNSDVSRVLIPVGADVRNVSEKSSLPSAPNIVFVGKLSADTNTGAAVWFAKNIFPTILSQFPSARFYIVGKDPSAMVQALEGESVIVTGKVESVDEYYEMADLVVIPLLHGGGVKVKLLEAVSYMRPIVTTETGLEGTLFENGIDMFVENEPKAFAEKCITLLSNKDTALKMVENAYRKFCDYYTWEQIGKKYSQVLNSVSKK